MTTDPLPATAHRSRARSLLALLALAVTSCATLTQDSELNQRYGAADPARFDVPTAPKAGEPRWADVKPILDGRCVVCHACYDGSCQLKFTAWEGVVRGASSQRVYESSRLLEAPMTRLFVDAQLPSQWRKKGFIPVLNERPAPEGNLAASVLYRSLMLKQANPLPDVPVLPEAYTLGLDRSQQCPSIEVYADFEKDHPQWGMPYALPGLDKRELEVITRWLAAGAPYEGVAASSAAVERQVQEWEKFFNGDSLKERLMSRYLYEHLFLAHLVFEGDTSRVAFRLVRSTTPPGTPVNLVVSRRPYDDPGVARVYYRLVPELETRVGKTYMPYVLSSARMDKYRGWFLAPAFTVDALPSYAIEKASNPFVTFQILPQESRYRFLLDEAQFFIMNFIKGPVCRGQIAVNVIDDRFWVVFVDPRLDAGAEAEALVRAAGELTLPAARGSNSSAILPWLQFADEEKKYLREKNRILERALAAPGAINLSAIWDGDGRNPNAALTIFRNFDNASVVQGFVGAPPKTGWVIGYTLFERLYYLLVTGYDVYGNAGHQLNSRLYMDFMRMEGESNFLLFLPEALRKKTAEYWYRDAQDQVQAYFDERNAIFTRETGIEYRTRDPQRELYALLTARLTPVLERRYALSTVQDETLRRELETLASVRGASLSWLPEMSVLRIDGPAETSRWFTLLRDTGHSNVSHLIREASALRPDENALTVVPGFIGDYPNAFYRLRHADLPAFTSAVRSLKSEKDYGAFAARYAVRRTNAGFWAHSDATHAAYRQWAPAEAALFDYNRLENR